MSNTISKVRQPATGATNRLITDKLNEYVSPADFGVVGDGITNDTAAMKLFFDFCISTGTPGFISGGDYAIQTGQLVFDNNFADAVGPIIETAGYEAVTFKAYDGTDAPFITFSNGTANSGAGRYWLGGHLGGITFSQNGKATGSNQHGLSLTGVWGMKFGWMRANDLGGSTVQMPAKLYLSTNPDPYAVSVCHFDGLEGNRNLGRVLDNQNYVGLNGCTFDVIRAINTGTGAIYGLGAGNIINAISAGECNGWAIDDGTQTANTGGSPSRTNIWFAEIDGCENGIRLNRQTISKFNGLRFVHRYKFSPNTTNLYWPLTCIDLNGGTLAGALTQLDIQAVHRLEAAMSASALNFVVGPNPITTSNGTNLITVNTVDDHTFTTGWTVAVLNATATGGVPATELNGEHIITVTGPKSFTYTSTTLATSTATGGGSTVALSPLDALGIFVNAHNNSNISGVTIDQFEINNAGFTSITSDPSRLYSNLTANSNFLLTRLDRPIGDSRIKNGFIVRGAAGLTIGTTYNSLTGKIDYNNLELYDRAAQYDSTNCWWVAPENGLATFTGRVTATPNAAATQLQVGVGMAVNGVYSSCVLNKKRTFTAGLGENTFDFVGEVVVVKGNQYFLMAAQNNGTSLTSAPISTSADLTWSAFMH